MMYVLLLLLLLVVLFAFFANDKDIIAPGFLFSVSFFGAALFATMYKDTWDLELHRNTFFVIILGVIEFVVLCLVIKKAANFFQPKAIPKEKTPLRFMAINKTKLLLFIAFEMVTIVYSVYTVVRLMNGSLSSFTESVVRYRNMNMFLGESTPLPKFVNYLRVIVNAGGYWFSYVLANNYFIKKKYNGLMVMIIFLSGLSTYILGGRNGLINIVIAVVCSNFLIKNKWNGFKNGLSVSTLIKLVFGLVLLLGSFESLALLIGRSGFESAKGLDYLAVYIGAPIKNLDTFLQEYTPTIGGMNQTFINLINWLGPKFHLTTSSYSLYLPFRSVGALTLGNVYTTFYAWIYDYGYAGVPFLIFFMAAISQGIYERVKRAGRTFCPPFSSLIYVYISCMLVMSFFSNKFYEQFFNVGFVQTLVAWLFLELFFCKITFKTKKDPVINTMAKNFYKG